jgi:molybdopterin molybdotransferase
LSMLSVQEAEQMILNLVQPLDSQDQEQLPLTAVHGRILAAPVVGNQDFPYWDNSAMDGYALRHADVAACSTEAPVSLEIIEEIPAGVQPQKTVQPGQAARIFTGAMLPAGADTIVMQEDTQRQGNQVTILTAPKPQAFVRRRAEFYQAGTPLLPAGILLSAPDIAVLATAQCTQVSVYRRPRVAIFSTGDELITPDQPLQPGQIVDSNQYALAALVASAGAEPVLLGVVPDQPQAIRQTIAQAIATADLVLSSGGVSVGDYDFIDQILAELNAEIHIRAVAVKPGKPLTVATFTRSQQASQTDLSSGSSNRPVLYFGLPGNPASVLVTFWRFVQPALRKLSGRNTGWQPVFLTGKTVQTLRSDGKRETYVWGRSAPANGALEFHLAGGSQSSGNLINLAQTNALAVLPVGTTEVTAGEPVQLMLLSEVVTE